MFSRILLIEESLLGAKLEFNLLKKKIDADVGSLLHIISYKFFSDFCGLNSF